MPITVVVTCLMGPGTFEAKIIPLSRSPYVKKIIVLRKFIGPPIEKVDYAILPGICKIGFFNVILTPLFLINLVQKNKADLILSYHFIPHAVFAFIASSITNVPYIVSQTGLYIQRSALKKQYRKIILYILRKAICINVPGQSSKRFWITNGIAEERINILHSKINAEIFRPLNYEKEYDFIYLGRLSKEKRVNLIINGIDNLNEKGHKVSLVIVGDGPEIAGLKKQVLELHLSEFITFTGFQPDPQNWLNKAKIFLLCSDSEGLPTALMQAMACKLISIAPDVGNISDLIINGFNGYLFSPDDITSFNKLMANTYLSYDSLKHIMNNARDKILAEYTYESATSQWNEIIKRKFPQCLGSFQAINLFSSI